LPSAVSKLMAGQAEDSENFLIADYTDLHGFEPRSSRRKHEVLL